MKANISSYKKRLADRMGRYYASNSDYHINISALVGIRPSLEEKKLFYKIKEFQRHTNQLLNILEIGCGSCDSAPALLSILGVKEYSGIDASQPAIKSAIQKYPNYNLAVGDAAHLPFEDNFFDVTVFNYVLEHMVYPDKVLSEAIRVTRPGGLIGMIVPVCDLPWLIPSSLRHQRKSLNFIIPYTLSRWIEFLRLRYQPNYYAFRTVDDPIILLNTKNYEFQPDDDLVYIASTFEVIKYLHSSGCEVLFSGGRDIGTCIMNGRRPIIDWLRWLAFACLRLSLLKTNIADYTTTASIVVRK
jgi:SAM-dependent methyltransferase